MPNVMLLLAAAGGDQASRPGGINPLILIAGMVAIFWFLIIAPQRKRDRERRQMLETLNKGNRVVTAGGVHGTVVSLSDDEVIVKVDPARDVTLKVSRSSISRIMAEEKDE